MKLNPANSRRGMTLMEVSVVFAVIVLLAAMLLPAIHSAQQKARRIHCNNWLMQMSLALKTWAVDHSDKYPMQLSVTNGGAMELAKAGDVVKTFQVISNELTTPRILICPADRKRIAAGSFAGLQKENVSYFFNLDPSESFPSAPLVGDDNLAIAGVPVSSGILNLSSNASVEWTKERHYQQGNVALADGSIQDYSNARFQSDLANAGLATNRLVIP
jgi:prepilin-type N-terminal cleavage/methylation domain-containing protein